MEIMGVTYDKYYQTRNLFGAPYPELIEFFSELPTRPKVLDVGCGQGRDAIALARMGYSVMGIDNSRVGIKQMNQVAKAENLDLIGKEGDIYSFTGYDQFGIVLLDSMFHFQKKDRKKEVSLISTILTNAKDGTLLVICIQDTDTKVRVLNEAIDGVYPCPRLLDRQFKYVFEDNETGHKSQTEYRMMVVKIRRS